MIRERFEHVRTPNADYRPALLGAPVHIEPQGIAGSEADLEVWCESQMNPNITCGSGDRIGLRQFPGIWEACTDSSNYVRRRLAFP